MEKDAQLHQRLKINFFYIFSSLAAGGPFRATLFEKLPQNCTFCRILTHCVCCSNPSLFCNISVNILFCTYTYVLFWLEWPWHLGKMLFRHFFRHLVFDSFGTLTCYNRRNIEKSKIRDGFISLNFLKDCIV